MNTSNEVCEMSGRYMAYGPCGHSCECCVIKGQLFPKCGTCGGLVSWTLLHETDDWGDYEFQWDAPTSRSCGMSINERLFAANLKDAFDEARRGMDRERMITVLSQVGVSLPAANRIADAAVATHRRVNQGAQ